MVVLENQTQEAANGVLLTLGENGVKAVKKPQDENFYTITVRERDQIKALAILNHNGQPRNTYVTLGEVFKKDSFISSPLEEEARFVSALNSEVSSMLMQLVGVVDVKVDISLPHTTDSLWKRANAEPAAAVVIKYKPEYKLNLYTSKIKQLVANAVPELSAYKVEVLTIPISDLE